MTRLLWIAGAALFAVAALSVWIAFQRPDFVAALCAAALAAAWRAVAPTLLKSSPETQRRHQEDVRRGVNRRPDGRERE